MPKTRKERRLYTRQQVTWKNCFADTAPTSEGQKEALGMLLEAEPEANLVF